MIFQSKTPLKFWVEAFYSVNFISNLLPSPSLNQKIPSEILFKKARDYSFLRVFGFVCYPCLRPFTQYKFEPRSLQCIFLGYHSQYKGYQCLYPPTGRVYISRHVVFDESCFPFMDRYKDFTPKHKSCILGAWQAVDVQITPLRALPMPSPPIIAPLDQIVEHPQDEATISMEQSPTQLPVSSPPIEYEEPGPIEHIET